MRIDVGPTGKLIHGHLLDCSQRGVNEALRRYDSQLYTKWNPKKNKGYGCWEIRRKPERKQITEVVNIGDMSIVRLEYKETDIACHVLDVPALNYNVLVTLWEMDTWRVKHWADQFEENERTHQEKVMSKNADIRKWQMKEHRTFARDLKDTIASGIKPAQILQYWGKQ